MKWNTHLINAAICKQTRSVIFSIFNPFLANVTILYHLKTPGNLWSSGIFKGYEIKTLMRNGLDRHWPSRQNLVQIQKEKHQLNVENIVLSMVVINEKDSGIHYINLLLLIQNLNMYLLTGKLESFSKSNINLQVQH